MSPFGPATEPDEIVVALYPPTASARRSLLAREFIGWLGSLVGSQKIHELPVWTDTATLFDYPHARLELSSYVVEKLRADSGSRGMELMLGICCKWDGYTV